MNGLRIIFKYPYCGCPELFEKRLLNIADQCTNHNYFILVIVDRKNEHAFECGCIVNKTNRWNSNRIAVIFNNDNSEITDLSQWVLPCDDFNVNWDIMIPVSDTKGFTKRGFDEEIRSVFYQQNPKLDYIITDYGITAIRKKTG